MIAELCAIALALAVGVPLARLLDRDGPASRVIGEGALLGFGLCAAMLAVLPWSRPIVVVTLVAIAIGLVARSRLDVAPAARRLDRHRLGGDLRTAGEPPALRWAALAFYAIAITALLGYALYATLAPPPEFDFLADWGLKARVFFEVRSIDWTFLGRAISRDTHPDYPLLLPLTYDFIAVLRNGWNDASLGVVHVAFAAALLFVIHGSAIDETRSRTAAAFMTAALVPLAATPWIGMAEGPFIAYATAALLAIRRGNTAIAAILLGLAASTKNEGLTLIAAVVIALACARRAREVARLWPALVIALPWLVVRSLHRLPDDVVAGGVLTRVIAHLRDPLVLIEALFSASLGKPFFWIALAVGIVMASRQLVRRERFVVVALLVQFVCYVGAYVATPYDVAWHVTYSWERLVAHLTPTLTYIVLAALLHVGRPSVRLDVKTSD